jgi:hypothetical protein
MFCPECRAEYRPGFTRCCDCDVNLVQDLPQSVGRPRKVQRDLMDWVPSPAIKAVYRESSKTLDWWVLYKRQTGTWPWSSIAVHFLNWVVALLGGGIFIWWSVEHHLSSGQFLAICLLLSVPYIILERWAKRAVKLNLLRNKK